MRPGLRRFLVGLGLVVLLAGVGIRAALLISGVASDLQTADTLVDRAATALEEGRLGEARAALSDAERLVLRANGSLRSSYVLDAVRLLPPVGDNIRSLEDSVALAATIVHGGARILAASSPLESEDGTLEVSMSEGAIPLDAVSAAEREIERLLAQMLFAPPPTDSRFLAQPVRDAQAAIRDEAVVRQRQLDVLRRGLVLLRHMAGGEGARRYVVAVANTAEMRGSGGMILNYGVLEGRDGTLELTAFGRIDELAIAGAVSQDLVPDDYLARWDGFDPLLRWRQANLSGDFTVVAPVLEAMYTSATRQPVHGVIQIDPVGLAALLDGVGPIVVPELGEVNGDNVVDLTMHEAYVRFPGVEERTDVLGDVAEGAFRRLVEGEIPSLRTLATRLVEAVDGRHIIMHTPSNAAQRELAAFGADGSLPPVEVDSFALTAQNLTGNKLDYFLDTDLQLRGHRPAGDLGAIVATVTLSNEALPGVLEPRYVYGPGFTPESPPGGVIRSLVTLYLPTGTSLEATGGDTLLEPPTSGTEAGRPYASFLVDVPAGEARTVELSLRLAPRPAGDHDLLVVPSPRLRPTTLAVDLDLGGTRMHGEVVLDRTWRFTPGVEPAPLIAPAFR